MPLLRAGVPTIDEESRFLDAYVSYVEYIDNLRQLRSKSPKVIRSVSEFHDFAQSTSTRAVNEEEQAFLRGEMQIPRTSVSNTDIRNVSKTSSKHLTGNELFDSIFLKNLESELSNISKQSSSSTRSWRSTSSFMGDMLPEKKTSKSRSFKNLLLAGAEKFRAHRNVHA